jgi:acetolactate decarboxylase
VAATAPACESGRVSEIEFLKALHVDMVRHRGLRAQADPHELFQTSTIEALLGGAFDGDVTLSEILEHGDLGLGTLNGLDGELIVIDGQAWKASSDCTLISAPSSSLTPYAVVVPFSPGPPATLAGSLPYDSLEQAVGYRVDANGRPVAIRIDGSFEHVRVRSVPKQHRPYPQLAEALAQERISELHDVPGTMVGFCFPNPLDGIEMVGWHLHFASDDRTRGGHVLDFTLREGTAQVDDVTELEVELPPAVDVHRDAVPEQDALRRLELDG